MNKITARNKYFIVPLFIAVFCVVSLASISDVQAHAEIVETTPTTDSLLELTPEYIEITFNEPVETTAASIRIFNSDGERIQNDKQVTQPALNIARLPLDPLENGFYAVAWNIVSADTHPVRGGFTFTVDADNADSGSSNYEPRLDDDQLEKILGGNQTPTSLRLIGIIFRALFFLSAATLTTLYLATQYLYRQDTLDKYSKPIFYVALTGIVSNIILVLNQIAWTQEISFIQSLNPTLISAELQTYFGKITLVIIALFTALAFIWKYIRQKPIKYLSIFLALALTLTPALSGHARTGDFVAIAIPMSFIHVLGAALWFGGLILARRSTKIEENFNVVKRLSKLATISIILITVSGLFAWWRQVGSLDAATGTWYGRVLTTKIVLFLVCVAIGYLSRQTIKAKPKKEQIQKLIKYLTIEILIIVSIYSTTAVLVRTIPARDSIKMPVTKQIRTEQGYIEIVVDPAQAGPGEIHLYVLQPNGIPHRVESQNQLDSDSIITLTLENKEKNVGPIKVNMRFLGLNHFMSTSVTVPFPGVWTLTARVNIDRFNQMSGVTEVHYR